MKLLTVTSVFPNRKQPALGVFVRERMFKVARHCELKVVAPVPWFPFINAIKKNYRPSVPYREVYDGIEIYHPRFFNIPRFFKFLDGFFFFLSSLNAIRKIKKTYDFDIIDSHFVYPDGLGAVLLGKFFRKPVTITVRGTIRKFFPRPTIVCQIRYALRHAARVFTVCDDLRNAAIQAGGIPENIEVVANGVDLEKFYPVDQAGARSELGLDVKRKIMISVGGLTRRKGFHRVMKILPELIEQFPTLLYVIVGGGSVEGNNESYLRQLASDLKIENHVMFAGGQPHNRLYLWLNAADIFCLATSNEGWANVFLEAMACGLPVVTTSVGGNPEVVSSDDVGVVVPFGDNAAMKDAIAHALEKSWNHDLIGAYAQSNSWEKRVAVLLLRFHDILSVA